jgi:phospholipid transport system substrate-binding protein
MKKIALILFILISNNAFADLKGAEKFTKSFTNKTLSILDDKNLKLEKQTEKLTSFIKENININWMSKFVLGRHWKEASSKQHSVFTELLEQYLTLSYAPKFKGYNGEEFQIISTKELRPNKQYVSEISLTLASGTPLKIELFILQDSNSYKIVDIAGEGISLAATQKAEFSSIIKANGITKFLEILKDKVKALEKQA